jgi:hypothetical protein
MFSVHQAPFTLVNVLPANPRVSRRRWDLVYLVGDGRLGPKERDT